MTDQERTAMMVSLMDIVGEMGLDNDLDWSQLSVDSYQVMQNIIGGVADLYADWSIMPVADRELIMLSVIAKLSIENFLLSLHKLAGSRLDATLWK